MNQIDGKPWYESRTIIAIIVSIIAKICAFAGIEINEESMIDLTLLMISASADIVAIWGRSGANQPIHWIKTGEKGDDE